MILELKDIKPVDKQYYLQHVIAPRPVCFASTINKAGEVNLSPFSFFNMFSSHPPVIIFSPARRLRDNSTKHTLQNKSVGNVDLKLTANTLNVDNKSVGNVKLNGKADNVTIRNKRSRSKTDQWQEKKRSPNYI